MPTALSTERGIQLGDWAVAINGHRNGHPTDTKGNWDQEGNGHWDCRGKAAAASNGHGDRLVDPDGNRAMRLRSRTPVGARGHRAT